MSKHAWATLLIACLFFGTCAWIVHHLLTQPSVITR
jgi:hypothetical protein